MLSRDVKIIDVDPRHWVNLVDLFRREKTRTRLLILVVENEICVKALHSERGPIPGFEFPGAEHLEKIRRENEVDTVAVVPADLLRRLFAAAQNAISHADDWDRQIAAMVLAARPFVRKEITWHPAIPFKTPDNFSMDRIEKIAGRFWPDGTCVGLFVFEGKTPYTSLILGKNASKITLMTTLDTFGLADGPLDRRTQRKTVRDLCRERYHPLHAALWIDLASFREMTAGPKALSYLRLARKRGRATLDPAPVLWRIAMFLARHFGGQ